MPLPVDYFQPESFLQANPLIAGIQAANSLYSQFQNNRYLAPMLAQKLQASQLANQSAGINNQYLPESLQSKINLNNAQIPLLGAQTQSTYAGIPLKNAQTNLANQQATNAKNFPVQGGIAGQLAYMNYIGKTKGTDSPDYQAARNAVNTQLALQNAKAQF